ncbi:MAG: hypothetical protein ACR2OZ_10120 [Verrucomicrobiales bacterium]
MRKLRLLYFGLAMLVSTRAQALEAVGDRPTVMVVVGAAGEATYGEIFSKQATQWAMICAAANIPHIAIGLSAESGLDDRERLSQALAAETAEAFSPFWLVLIGHGTFDGREARFNLRGPDLAAADLAEWIKPLRRPLVIINTSSASAPFLAKLAGPNRIVISATRSGHESNFARFGGFLAASLADPAADLDQDRQTSLLEAFLKASHLTAEFYATEGRLATEHALIDDNGDGLGTSAEWFRGIRATKKARDNAAVDGARAHQCHLVRTGDEQKLDPAVRARRDALELQIATLREIKYDLDEDEYYQRIEALFLQLAKLYTKPANTGQDGAADSQARPARSGKPDLH